jgi:AcrR family transcriptional regulator
MQRIDEEKRKRILEIAGKLFREGPFHEVRLEDVAAKARIGKGTIYIYFQSKADLCRCLMIEGMTEAIGQVRDELSVEGLTPPEKIERLVRSLLTFARRHGDFRSMEMELRQKPDAFRPMMEKREELIGIIEGVLREGMAAGLFEDAHPGLTARYLLAILRELAMFPTADLEDEAVARHVVQTIGRGILRRP